MAAGGRLQTGRVEHVLADCFVVDGEVAQRLEQYVAVGGRGRVGDEDAAAGGELVLAQLVRPEVEHVVGLIGGRGGEERGRARRRVPYVLDLGVGEVEPLRQLGPVELVVAVGEIVGEQADVELDARRLTVTGRACEHVVCAACCRAAATVQAAARAVEEGERLEAALQSGLLLQLVVLDGLAVVGRQLDVERADGRRAHVRLEGGVLGVAQEDEPTARRRLLDVLDAHLEGHAILVEGHEVHAELRLLERLIAAHLERDGHNVAAHLEPLRAILEHLDLLALGDGDEVVAQLERLLLLVVGDAVDAQLGLAQLVTLAVHHKARHERHRDRLAIQLRRHLARLAHILTIHEPKSFHA